MNLTEISSTQRFDVVTANNNFEATKGAAVLGIKRETTVALTLGLYGGMFWTGSAFSDLSDTTVALTGSATNYVEANRTTGAVTVNQSAFTAGRIQLYQITTNANGITGVTDYRTLHLQGGNAYIGSLTTDSLTIAQGTLTDPATGLAITATWNDAADTFVAADMNITNTNSAAASLLQRWRVGGAVMASISKAGAMVLAAGLTMGGALAGVTTGAFSGQITSTLATGTAPFSVASTTVVSNLNVSQLLGSTWAAPGTIGSGTPSTGAFTTLSATTATIASGTITDSAPALNITQTWNDAADTFVGADLNITNTASALSSFLQRWRVGGGAVSSMGLKGNLGVGADASATHALRIVMTPDGTGGTTRGVYTEITAPATATSNVQLNRSAVTLSDGGGVTYADVVIYQSATLTKSGAGDTITKATSFRAANLSAAALNIAFEGLENASGTSRYNLYMSGTAPNYLEGYTGIGATPSASTRLLLTLGTTAMSSLRIPHGAAPTSPVDGDIWTTTAGLFARINGATVGPYS